MSDHVDFCVIGAGTAGFAAAAWARGQGRSVLVASGPGDLGGTCILRGCMPAKTLFAATERLGDVESAEELGVRAEAARADLPAIIARKRELIDYFAQDRVAELETFPLARGWARFVAPDAIEVDGRRISAERFLIATGSHIAAPAIEGLGASGYLTSDDALDLTRIPRSIAVLGGGPVGCEFAQYFARLGARVTLVQREDNLLRKEDPDIGRAIESFLVREGVEVLTGHDVLRVARSGGTRTLTLSNAHGTREVRVGEIMLASNRVPNIENLGLGLAGVDTVGLDVAGVDTAGLAVAVNPYLRTTNERIYAAGDAIGRRCLVHVAEYAGRLAARNAFAADPVTADFERFEAHAVYTQPQVAVAGLTELACRARGLAVRVQRHPFRDVGKALVAGEPEGFIKMLAAQDGTILGIALVGDGASEMIGEAVALIDARATTRTVADMPHLHPTMSEIFARVADDFAREDAAAIPA